MCNLILNKVNLISLHFFGDSTCRISRYFIRKNGNDTELVLTDDTGKFDLLKSKYPLLIIVSGYGVIAKAKNDSNNQEIIEQVKQDEDSFIYNEDGDCFLFARKSLIEGPLTKISPDQVVFPIELYNANDIIPEDKLKDFANSFLCRNTSWRNFCKPSAVSDVVMEWLYKRWRLHLLVVTFILLTLSRCLQSGLTKEYESLNFQVEKLKRDSDIEKSHLQDVKHETAQFGNNRIWPLSYICDCIAASVPEQVALKSLAVFPAELSRTKLPSFDECIIIEGSSTMHDSILDFVSSIEKYQFSNDVVLDFIRQEKKKDVFSFKISIKIK